MEKCHHYSCRVKPKNSSESPRPSCEEVQRVLKLVVSLSIILNIYNTSTIGPILDEPQKLFAKSLSFFDSTSAVKPQSISVCQVENTASRTTDFRQPTSDA